MSWLWEKIKDATHYRAPEDFAEIAVEVIANEVEEIEKRFEKRLYAIEHHQLLNASRRAEMTTAERCREDNERI